MINKLHCTLLVGILSLGLCQADTKANQDNLLFKDGGNLYGEFKGFSDLGEILWSRKNAAKQQSFPVKEISQLSINGARPRNNASIQSYVKMVNGDILPGLIIAADGENITLKTHYSGELILPSKHVVSYHPTPEGSVLLSNGFSKNDAWQNIPFSYSHENVDEQKKVKKWELHGASWYTNPDKAGALFNPEIKLPNDFVMKFNYAYQGTPSINLAIMADMQTPKQGEETGEKPEQKEAKVEEKRKQLLEVNPNKVSGAANTFGNCLSLTLGTNYYSLSACGVSADSNQAFSLRQKSSTPRRYDQRVLSQIDVELRVSRKRNVVTLFYDGKIAAEWHINEDVFPKTGDKIAFFSQSSNRGSVRISNLRISEWHGILDSPKAGAIEGKDVIILNNGTDRFSGQTVEITEPSVKFETSYSSLNLPAEAVKSIHFAIDSLEECQEGGKLYAFNFFNSARIHGMPLKSNDTIISVKTPYAEKIDIPLNQLRSIELEETSDLIESWSNKH